MMTHEEIKAAVERLRATEPSDYVGYVASAAQVVWGFMDGTVSALEFRDALIALLEQADPDTHVELPVDADGIPIHIGDEMYGGHCEDGTVMGIQYYEGLPVLIAVRPRNWDTPSWCDPAGYRHHHKPTVSEILDELEGLRGTGDYESVVMRAAELAEQLRELLEVITDNDAR